MIVLLGLTGAISIASQEPPRDSSRYDGPKPVSPVIPEYPPVLVSACVQGIASIVVELDQSGKVVATDFISGSPFFEQLTIDAARQWIFESTAKPERRRQVLRFSFTIVPRRATKKEATSFLRTSTDVEVRSYFAANNTSCLDCDARARRRAQSEYEKRCAG